MTELSPFVYWAQTEDIITLKVDLKDVKKPDVRLGEKKLQFSGHGHGARGEHDYSFTLDFHSEVNPDESKYKVMDRQVEMTLKKESNGWWPRLTATPQKPVWLKIDFDRWKMEDVDDEEEPRDVLGDYPGLYEKLEKEELGYRKEDLKKVYLIFYNLCQFVGFTYILTVMAIRYLRDGPVMRCYNHSFSIYDLFSFIYLFPDSMEGTYEAVGGAIKFCQLMQILEIMHPLFGYTRGGVLNPFMQKQNQGCGRNLLIFYLFSIWSLVEFVRYPFYISQLFKKNASFLVWLRYTIWIPLYPLGFLCEGVVILRDIPYFEETQRFTVSLPNAWNFTFHFPTVLRIYLLLIFFPEICKVQGTLYK
ncbi:hypothetical protein L9F63_025000, partial [Diploptera punctata]